MTSAAKRIRMRAIVELIRKHRGEIDCERLDCAAEKVPCKLESLVSDKHEAARPWRQCLCVRVCARMGGGSSGGGFCFQRL